MKGDSARARGRTRVAWSLLLLLASCADASPRPAPLPRAAASNSSPKPPPPPAASSAPPAPSAAASAEPAAAKPRPPPIACPPRPGYAPVGFLHSRGELRGPHGYATFGAPRLETSDPRLAPSLNAVQSTIDAWIDEHAKGALTCGKGCDLSASCEITRNDGVYLSLVCPYEFSYAEWRAGGSRESLLFRRDGDQFKRVSFQSFARDPKASLLFRLLPTWSPDTEKTLDEEKELGGFYVALHDADFEIGTSQIFDPTSRWFRPFTDIAHHLTCDALFDLPSGPPSPPSAETGALAFATHIAEADDPVVAAYWFGSGSSVEMPRFIAMEPRHEAAARALNNEVDGYLRGVRARAKAEAWTSADATCRVYTSTSRLVSVLCYGGGSTKDGSTRVARGSITLRLTDPPERVVAADIFAAKPRAPAEIAKLCLNHLVHKPADELDETLKALPKLTAADLSDVGLMRGGAMFAVEYELAGKPRLMPCYVPNKVIGTSGEMLALPKKKKP